MTMITSPFWVSSGGVAWPATKGVTVPPPPPPPPPTPPPPGGYVSQLPVLAGQNG